MRTPVVPTTPGARPAARKIDSRRKVVVVFPFVPVTPTSGKRSDGRPKNAADIGPIAHRTVGTMTCAQPTGTGRSATTATAPAARPPAAKSCPSTCRPGTQKNRAPGGLARTVA